jgi:hypothetical protein
MNVRVVMNGMIIKSGYRDPANDDHSYDHQSPLASVKLIYFYLNYTNYFICTFTFYVESWLNFRRLKQNIFWEDCIECAAKGNLCRRLK